MTSLTSCIFCWPTSAGLASGWKVLMQERVDTNMPMGWASYLKLLIMSLAGMNVWVMTFFWNCFSWEAVGSSPQISRKATSRKELFSASTSMG